MRLGPKERMSRRRGSPKKPSNDFYASSYSDDDNESELKLATANGCCQIDLKLRFRATRYFITVAALSVIALTFVQALHAFRRAASTTTWNSMEAGPIELYPTVLDADGQDVCTKKLHTTETLWIAMPAWDDVSGLQRALQSVIDQEQTGYDKVHVVVFEDRSNNMLTQDQKDYYSSLMEVTFLENNESEKNLGSAYGKWRLFEWIRKHALPHEYTLVLDGDDTLADNLVLGDVHLALSETKPWFAWGRHNGKYSEQCHDLSIKGRQTIRSAEWSFCHPRMFQSHLLHHIQAEDFQRDDGTWLQKATDRPFIFQFMEMAGPKRMAYLGDRPLYNYTMGSHNGLKVFKPSVINGDKKLINSRSPAKQSPDTIHVITCVYDRPNTRDYLEHIMTSKLEKGKTLKIHICNNKSERQSELEELIGSLSEQKQFLDFLWRHKTPDIKFRVYDMGGNHGGFSRFLLARQVMRKEFVDYIVMMDDDQYVTPYTISEVYERRRPRSFFTWYGKNWHAKERSYWKAREHISTDPANRYREHGHVSTWQYGGTGMSIIDASIFLNVELFDIEKKFLFVEDVWLSYILQLSGWHIGRLKVKFIDAGHKFRTTTGQWTNLKPLKEEFFEKVGFLACNMPRAPPNDSLLEPPSIAA